jgi:predicted dehydrogenase
MPRPSDTPPVPDQLDWDLWLGPAAWRPYHPAYVPAMWRGWLDFGTGALGDMGCHILDPVFWALKLGSPLAVEANTTHYQEENASETYPVASIVRFEFPARHGMPPLKLTWFDGGMLPPRPSALPSDEGIGSNGAYFLGSEGTIAHGSHGASNCRILEATTRSYPAPPESIERVLDHHQDWLGACRGGQPASSSFAYGGPLTEMVLLGVIAMRIKNMRLLWDAERKQFTNSEEANALVSPVFREPWTL